jgi:hypothetical protein
MLLFARALAAMGAMSLVYSAIMTHVLRTPHPYGVTLFWDGFVGSDFSVFAERSHHFGAASYWDEFNYPFTYPAPLGLVFALFFKLAHPLAVYLGLCGAGLIVWAVCLVRGLAAAGIGVLHGAGFAALMLAAAWPVVALFNTANIEGLVAILLAAGVYGVLRERYWLGATLIGLAAAMKLFPFILLALLLSRRRWKEFAWGLAVAALTTIVSLAALGPTIIDAQRHIADGLRFVDQAFILSTQRDALNYSHSLFSIVKFVVVIVARGAGWHDEAALLSTTLRVYMVAAAIGGVALYFAIIRKLPMLNQLLALTVCAVLLPPLSADYTLLELLLPFGLLCLYAAESGERLRALAACFGCFAALFAWETFLTIRYSFDRPMRTLALTVLLIIVLRWPLPWPRFDSTGATA